MQRPTPRHRRDADPALAAPAAAGYASTEDSDTGGAELLEDRAVRITGGRHGRRFGMSVPGAIVGTFLVSALALGAAFGPLATKPASDSVGNRGGDTAIIEPTDKIAGDVPAKTERPEGGTDGTDGTEPDKTTTPDATVKPEPTEAPAPATEQIEIGLAVSGTSVVVEWSACETDGFLAYKVIRSRDAYATWPMGTGDSLVGVIENQATTRFVDKAVDGGRTYRYLVVALRSWDGDRAVACRSETAAIATPAPTPKPQPTDGGDLALTVVIKEGRPFLDWSACAGIDFDYYKVVRSTDSTVAWPKGDNDSLVTAIGADGDTKAWDGESPTGQKVWYRVFCVVAGADGYIVKAASPVRGVEVPAGEPAPEPVALGFEANVTGEGVVLGWQACSSDVFTYYKVVRSTTNENPSYLPWTDGTELIGVIENAATTGFTDGAVASGQTIRYRVQCIGYGNGGKVLVGETAAIAVTIP